MKANIRSIVLILPLLLSSCFHKTSQAVNQPALAPPIDDAPLPKPDNAPANLPPPVISLPEHKDPTAPPPTPKPETPTQAPKHKKPSNKATPNPAAQTTEQASNASPGVPAAGNLSPGGNADLKDQTQSVIAETERSLNGINRTLNDQETKTSLQIREFLKQARAALNSNDVDGAHTLALKAKALMTELLQ